MADQELEAASWEAVSRAPELTLVRAFRLAVAWLAVAVAGVEPEVLQAGDPIRACRAGHPPEWWPARLPRLVLEVRALSPDRPPARARSVPIDLNRRDQGEAVMLQAAARALPTLGLPFHGALRLAFTSPGSPGEWSQWERTVAVGLTPQGQGGGSARTLGRLVRSQQRLIAQQAGAMVDMFGGASSVIHASAETVKASAGLRREQRDEQRQGRGEDRVVAGLELATEVVRSWRESGRGDWLGELVSGGHGREEHLSPSWTRPDGDEGS